MPFSRILLGVAALISGCSHLALADGRPLAQQQQQQQHQPREEGRRAFAREPMLRPAQPLQPPGSQSLTKAETSCQDVDTTEVHVTITVFGTYNEDHPKVPSECSFENCPDKVREAMQWIFTVVLRSMTYERDDERVIRDEECDIQGDMPEYTASEVPPAYSDEKAPGGKDADQRTPLHRTFFRLKFPKVAVASAGTLVENLCTDYYSDGEELIYGILRALPDPLYPQDAVTRAAALNLGLKNVVHISTKPDQPACPWNRQLQHATEGKIAAFFLPTCPPNAHHKKESTDMQCECDAGYHSPGGIESVGFGEPVEDGEPGNKYKKYGYNGECIKRKQFCPPTNKDGYPMIRVDSKDSNEPALGEIKEKARAECPKDSRYVGQAECRIDHTNRDHGAWVSAGPLCHLKPPKAPPSPRCIKPKLAEFEYKNCDSCPSIGGSKQCSCQVRCGDDYLQVDELGKLKPAPEFVDDPIPCKALPYDCPVQQDLDWKETACIKRSTGESLPEHCCKEAWDGYEPPAELTPAQCDQITEDRQCFRSKQSNGHLQEAPCCWSWHEHAHGSCKPRGPETDVKDSHGDPVYHCAVTTTVMVAHFDESRFPRCEKKCIDNLSPYERTLEVKGCKDCSVSTKYPCQCDVQCSGETVRWGGGAVGTRQCIVNDFGMRPSCQPPLANDGRCSAPPLEWMLDSNKDCESCEVGQQCSCVAKCKDGYTTVPSSDGIKMSCKEEQAKLHDEADCTRLSDKQECLSSKSGSVPCCWMRHADGKPPCAKFGSEIISDENLPEACAIMKTAVLGPVPECKEHCVDIYSNDRQTNNLVVKGCEKCVEGDPACPCDVRCTQDTDRYGGGSQGKRICGAQNSFPAAPLCLPQEQPPVCDEPGHVKFANVRCAGCEADNMETCECNVECQSGFANIRSSVLPVCKSVPADLRDASCEQLQEKEDCLASKHVGGALEGSMCCWHSDGFGPHGGTPKCAPKGSELISREPQACTKSRVAVWDEKSLPVCKQKCKNNLQGDNIKFSPSWDACNQCIAGEPCDCKVSCMEKTSYSGGGPLGERSCTEENLDFAAAPMCARKEETVQVCKSPSQATFRLEDCQEGCTPGKPCQCKIFCQDHLVHVDGKQGGRQCVEEKNQLDRVSSCSSITISNPGEFLQCYGSQDEDNKRCCIYGTEGAQGDQFSNMQCEAEGSSQVTSPVLMCARERVSRWQPPEPVCKPKCKNIFKRPELVNTGCDSCEIGGENCECKVTCNQPYERYGGPERPERSCPQGGFARPPVCFWPEKEPFCTFSGEMIKSLSSRNCPDCEAGQQCACDVQCDINKGFVRADGEPNVKVRLGCSRHQHLPGSEPCENRQGRQACIESLDKQGKPCVFQRTRSGGFCAVKGSPRIEQPPEESDVAKQFYAEWEGMPLCLPQCQWQHTFDMADNLEIKGCNICHIKMGKNCPCTVKCAADHIRYGGGPQGQRSCNEKNPFFEPPPLCMKIMKPTCWVQKYWLRGKINHVEVEQKCEDCIFMDRCGPGFKCNMHCSENTILVDGKVGTKTCLELENDKLKTAECTDIFEEEECKSSKDQVSQQPCCYRPKQFSSGGVCAARGSSSIGFRDTLEPSDCAPMTRAEWNEMPKCEQRCKNIFNGIEHLQPSDGCESCTVSQCHCTVDCAEGWKPRDVETTNLKKCMKQPDESVKFEPADNSSSLMPVCIKPCDIPDTAGGTLDVSNCQKCLPGEPDCSCTVKCAKGTVHAGGGPAGTLQCGTDGKYMDLPYCIPECETPPNQHETLDTTNCPNCQPDRNCDCILKCKGKRVGEGPEGPYKCVRVEPKPERASAAVVAWKAADEKALAGKWPLCMSKIFVNIISATTHAALENAELQIYVRDSPELIETKTTGHDGKVELDTTESHVTLVATLNGYKDVVREFDRDVNCPNPSQDCGTKLSMSPVLVGGSVKATGCYFQAEPIKAELQMRAVLSWDQTPGDIDIWASNSECMEDVKSRHKCSKKADPDCRKPFQTNKKDEIKSCGINACMRDPTNWKAINIKNGKPDCPGGSSWYANQFAKWVFFRTRRLNNIDKRISGKELKQFDAPTVDTVELAGFPDNTMCGKDTYCDHLNVEFVERKKEFWKSETSNYYSIGGHSTYWEYLGLRLIFYCESTKKWCVGPSARLQQFKEDCSAASDYVWACSDEDASLQENLEFEPLWDHRSDKPKAKPFVRVHRKPASKNQWNPENYMLLDVDEVSGYGPETITFNNVPPGTYQIAANIFSPAASYYPEGIKKGNPILRIIVGSDNLEFVCKIDKTCKSTSRIWNVANIRILDAGEVYENGGPTGKHKYFIRVLDRKETMPKLSAFDLGTTQRKTDEYFALEEPMMYNDAQLQDACVGVCTPPKDYETCMERPPL